MSYTDYQMYRALQLERADFFESLRRKPTSVKQRKAVKKVMKKPESLPLTELTAGLQQGDESRIKWFAMVTTVPAKKKKKRAPRELDLTDILKW